MCVCVCYAVISGCCCCCCFCYYCVHFICFLLQSILLLRYISIFPPRHIDSILNPAKVQWMPIGHLMLSIVYWSIICVCVLFRLASTAKRMVNKKKRRISSIFCSSVSLYIGSFYTMAHVRILHAIERAMIRKGLLMLMLLEIYIYLISCAYVCAHSLCEI